MRHREIIGHGTWLDKVAYELVEREKKLGRSLDLIRTESGLGASGIPHVGSMADAVRAYGVTMALRELGYNSELIAFSDDMDGLRKVPEGLPSWLEDHLLEPVSSIPDPLGCHRSYSEHMSGMLKEALERAGIECIFMSGREVYASGKLANEIHEILLNWRKIGEAIKELTGQEKFMKVLPYFPVCKNCGKIYTTQAYQYDPKRRIVKYRCVGAEIKGKWFKGCGYEGEADITKDDGKLAWKVEFAARWRKLDIRFEAYGKDIADSVKVNDWVSKNILGYEPPMHVRYEMFLDKSGRKISKSLGNVFTPQLWYRYGTPQSLLLLLFKRIVGTRILTIETIPRLMDELDYLEDVYFERIKIGNEFERERLKGLYLYSNLLKPPERPSSHIPYSLIVELALIAPEDKRLDFVVDRLRRYGYEIDERALQKIKLAINYALDMGVVKRELVELTESEKNAVKDLAERIKVAESSEDVQSAIFEIARKHGIGVKQFFKKLYLVFLGKDHGPRLGPYLWDLGKERALQILKQYIEE
ncbi:MAG: lysine--tRNA ligase [Thaumarchaeota archaeon]|nr:MAG: lysine--tRNA ligase [Nitrososphaerota archaeon]